MRQLYLILLVSMIPVFAFNQEKPVKLDADQLRSKMVLRSNTRDKVTIVKDNQRRQQMQIRKNMIINQQKKVMHQRMRHVQSSHLRHQRIIQQRKIRQEATRKNRFQGR